MLFTTAQFLFVFMPICLCVSGLVIASLGRRAGLGALIILSIIFYAQWRMSDLGIIALSIIFNFLIARILYGFQGRLRTLALWCGVTVNLLGLGYFKYTDFLLINLGQEPRHIVLPLAISFYTFQQIAFIVDVYRGKVARIPFVNYVVTVLFFPHLIAGPLIHYEAIMEQFERRFAVNATTILAGLPVFTMGLAKKVAIADPIATVVSPLLATAQAAPLEFFSAWTVALGYTVQLYVDFSGYSDMAIGLGLMFGIRLPLNFYSPYKSTSIIEFWRRWHITLSSFLRDYLYIPLGGNRVSRPHWYTNLVLVMVIGGLWHGAGWNFVLWGGLHGTYLAINHLWRHSTKALSEATHAMLRPAYAVATFGAVLFAWIFFSAASFGAADNVLKGMAGYTHASLPGEITYWFPSMPGSSLGIAYDGRGLSFATLCFAATALLVSYGATFFAPNTAEFSVWTAMAGCLHPVR